MKKEVLKLKIVEINEKYSVGYIHYQDESVLKRGAFRDYELNVHSECFPIFIETDEKLMIRGSLESEDEKSIFLVPNDKVEKLKEKVKKLNEKYGVDV